MLVILLLMAVAFNWGIAWKIIVGADAIYVLTLIVLKLWKNRN